MQKLYLIDAYALIYRAYYAFISRPMRNAEGMNTSAVFGFTKFVKDLIKRESPQYLGAAFDPSGGNFRHQLYPQYKANREAMPEDIRASVPHIKQILEAMRIPILEVAGYEADDVIGTLSQKAAEQGFEVYMVTPDKDYGQLIGPSVFMYKPRSGEGFEIIGCDAIKDIYGIDDPRQVIDILALWGDASDNIPGVPGVGEKSAIKLVCQFGSVENLLENTYKLSGKQKDNVVACSEQILLAKKLATIDLDVPIDFRPEELLLETPDLDMLAQRYREMGFRALLQEIEGGNRYTDTAAHKAKTTEIKVGAVQQDLFGLPMASTAVPVAPNAAPETSSQAALGATQQSVPAHMTANQFENRAVQQNLGSEIVDSTTLQSVESAEDSGNNPAYATLATTPHTYHTVTQISELEALCQRLIASHEFCFDTETTGLDPMTSRMVGISFSIKASEAWYVPCDKENIEHVTELLKPVFGNEKSAKIGHNLKFDIMVLRTLGIRVRGELYDTMIIHYLLNPESRHGMDYLARTYLNYAPVPIEALIGRGAKQITMDMVPLSKAAEYGCEDSDVTIRLKEVLWPQLKNEGLQELYLTVEEPLISVLADMEMTGIRIDSNSLAIIGDSLNAELEGMESTIREMAQSPLLNVNSTVQLGEVLFEKLKIDPKPKLTKTKRYRTDEEYLVGLSDRHPIIAIILEYRTIRKLLSTYVESLPLLVNPVTGHIHTSFNQAVTSTGRLSSTNPNLQNIPIRGARGREIRKAFIPSAPDRLLLSADYSQVELRLMAHLSQDKDLIEAFTRGEDIHTATAAKIFGIELSEVTKDMRRKAKTANFGIIYGISAFGLSQRLNIPRSEAKEIIDGYFEAYPGVKRYMDDVIEKAREDGYVETLFGRKRFLPDIRSANAVVRALAERNAINAPIQGGAADIMKVAMISIHRELESLGLRSKLVLQVHDEVVVDTLASEEQTVRKVVVRCMESATSLRVSLIADCVVGQNWVDTE